MSVFPPPLAPGDLIGVAAPAGYLQEPERYVEGCAIIRDMGFEIYEPGKQWPGYGYLADSDENRVRELHRLWDTPDIKAVFALRGGYGCLRLLQHLDIDLFKKNRKLFVGFSDITVLHSHLYERTGSISLHGPGLATLASSDQKSRERLYHCLRGHWHRTLKEDIEIVRGAAPATGPLLGGNLSSLVTMLGTPWFPDLSGSILLLEDVNEVFYRIDRLLTQLQLSGTLDRVHGIILGQFCDNQTDPTEQLRINEFVWHRTLELTRSSPVAVWGNFPVGHCRRNLALPLGAICTMDSQDGCLHFSDRKYDD